MLVDPVITGTSERSYLLITCVTQGPLMYVTEVGNIISYKSSHLNRAYLDAHYIVDNNYFKSLLQVSVV